MCLYPTLGKNPKYKANKKNGGVIPAIRDLRHTYVAFRCNKCMECRKQQAREWQVRLLEEVRNKTTAKFITLTFSDESISKLLNQKPTKNWPSLKGLSGYNLDNALATRAVRLFTERWRKKYKKTIRHFLISELGHEGTENIHLHGILWTNASYDEIYDKWQYGWIWPNTSKDRKNNYVSERTVNYIIKYITKIDRKHETYIPIKLCSNGIGKTYTERMDAIFNKYNGLQTDETYTTTTGHRIAMPTYWRNKLYTEEERENLWSMKLDKQERWVGKERVDISKGDENYWKLLKYHRAKAKELGYQDDTINWEKRLYEMELRNLNTLTRLMKANEGYNTN